MKMVQSLLKFPYCISLFFSILLAGCGGSWDTTVATPASSAGQTPHAAAAAQKAQLVMPPGGRTPPAFTTELVIRTVENFAGRDDVVAFFDKAKQDRISVVHLNIKQDEDDERPSGQVFYASRIAPIAQGYETFDALAVSIEEAHKRGIKVYAWMPQFHDQTAALANPDWQMRSYENGVVKPYTGRDRTEYFINPIHPGVQAYEQSLIEEVVQNYDVDGISLDWVRFDGFNMDVGDYTRRQAISEIGIDPMDLDFTKWSPALEVWNDWRGQKIADYLHRLRQSLKQLKPNMFLGAFVLPPFFTDVGQDLALFGEDLDVIMPMAYFNDWGYSPDWVTNTLMRDVRQKLATAHATAAIRPTLDLSGTDAQLNKILTSIQMQYPASRSIIWFSAFYWSGEDMDRIAAITAKATR